MSKYVRVKVTSTNKVVNINEEAAQRMAKADPKEYTILEPVKVEVINLPPLAEKKNVVVAENEKQVIDAQVEEKRKPGRPKVNA